MYPYRPGPTNKRARGLRPRQSIQGGAWEPLNLGGQPLTHLDKGRRRIGVGAVRDIDHGSDVLLDWLFLYCLRMRTATRKSTTHCSGQVSSKAKNRVGHCLRSASVAGRHDYRCNMRHMDVYDSQYGY